MLRKLIIPALIAVATVTSARAAYLTDVEGIVLVNDERVAASLQVSQGDRVRVADGSANIVYSNGAVVPVPSGHTLVVLANPPERQPTGDGGLQPQDGHEGEWVIAGTVGLAILLSQIAQPASP